MAGPNVLLMLKTFEVEKYRRAFEVYSNCTLTAFYIFLRAVTAFQQHSKNSDRLRGRIETASHFKSCQNVPNAPRMSQNAPQLHLDCCRNLFRYQKNSAGMQFECRRNHSIAARMRLECSRNVPIGPRMSPDVIQNTAEPHIQEYIKNFHSDVIPAHSGSSMTRVWNSLPNVARILKILHSGWFCLILLIPNKYDGGIKEKKKSGVSTCTNITRCPLHNIYQQKIG